MHHSLQFDDTKTMPSNRDDGNHNRDIGGRMSGRKRPREEEAIITNPKKKSKAHTGRDLQEKGFALVDKRIKQYPNETFRNPNNGFVECQACGKDLKADATTIKRHLGIFMSCVLHFHSLSIE